MQPLPDFASRLLAWFDEHGRHDLPWQQERSCYRVWLAEIMLQQTQVKTVIPYYERFLRRFPDVQTLAAAPLDEVLALWSGLGYYARARNLHRAAQLICAEHGGRFPEAIDPLTRLPGVGRSTAGAILAQALGQRHPILDGNVRRVLCRLHAVKGAPTTAANQQALWELADRYTPGKRVADYTQAVMDLGATLCTPRQPRCSACPFLDECLAYRQGAPERFPERKASTPVPAKRLVMLLVRDPEGRILLERRPPAGVWGGLWSLPEAESVEEALAWSRRRFGTTRQTGELYLEHLFSHFRLVAQVLRLETSSSTTVAEGELEWLALTEARRRGLPAPLKKMLLAEPEPT